MSSNIPDYCQSFTLGENLGVLGQLKVCYFLHGNGTNKNRTNHDSTLRIPNSYRLLLMCNTKEAHYVILKPYGLAKQLYFFHSLNLLKVILCVCVSCSVIVSLTLCDPMDSSPPGSSVRGILQARILEWVAISLSKNLPWPRDKTWVFGIASRFFTSQAQKFFFRRYYLPPPSIPTKQNKKVNSPIEAPQ